MNTSSRSAPQAEKRIGISVVTPVYGCTGCLEELADRVEHALKHYGESIELIMVDDGGPGDPWSRIRELASRRPWLTGIRLSRNFGQHHAISAGLEMAHGDTIVVMDCDLQDIPENIPVLIDHQRSGYDVVFARRFNRQDKFVKKAISWLFYKMLSWLTGTPQDHQTANFGAFSRRAIDVVNSMPETERFFPLMVRWAGFNLTSIDLPHAARAAGASSYNIARLLRLAVDIVISYSDKPLQLVVKTGLLFGAGAIALAVVAVVRYLHGDIQVAGYTSIMASIWLVGGAIIACLGVVSLYVGRIFVDIKRRPSYVISETTVPRTADER
jgi:dolichol-phosphate mannosyltransferase